MALLIARSSISDGASGSSVGDEGADDDSLVEGTLFVGTVLDDVAASDPVDSGVLEPTDDGAAVLDAGPVLAVTPEIDTAVLDTAVLDTAELDTAELETVELAADPVALVEELEEFEEQPAITRTAASTSAARRDALWGNDRRENGSRAMA